MAKDAVLTKTMYLMKNHRGEENYEKQPKFNTFRQDQDLPAG